MLVRDCMTPDPITVAPTTSFDDALRLMRERKVRRFPVISPQHRLVGMLSEKDLLNAAPSPATTLARYEVHTLLAQLAVGQVMSQQVITVMPDMPIEEAARLMADHKIGGLPVVEEQRGLVGIVTETDLFRTMVDMLGARTKGLRLQFQIEDQRGMLAKLVGEVSRQGGNIVSVSVFHGSDALHPVIVIKVEGGDEERLVAMLRGTGATIQDIRKI